MTKEKREGEEKSSGHMNTGKQTTTPTIVTSTTNTHIYTRISHNTTNVLIPTSSARPLPCAYNEEVSRHVIAFGDIKDSAPSRPTVTPHAHPNITGLAADIYEATLRVVAKGFSFDGPVTLVQSRREGILGHLPDVRYATTHGRQSCF